MLHNGSASAFQADSAGSIPVNRSRRAIVSTDSAPQWLSTYIGIIIYMYTYYTKIEKVIDGDTVDVFIDLGFNIWHKERIRLIGIDTAERSTPFGKATKQFLSNNIENKMVKIEVFKPDKYGRYLGKIYLSSEESINDQLVRQGIAKAYFGDSKSSLWTDSELAKTQIDAIIK